MPHLPQSPLSDERTPLIPSSRRPNVPSSNAGSTASTTTPPNGKPLVPGHPKQLRTRTPPLPPGSQIMNNRAGSQANNLAAFSGRQVSDHMLPLKKRGQGARSWLRIDERGEIQTLEVDKARIMRRCQLPARDLRLLDPMFVYPSTILGREKAIVVSLEKIHCIIMAEEVLVLNTNDSAVFEYTNELQRRIRLSTWNSLGGVGLDGLNAKSPPALHERRGGGRGEAGGGGVEGRVVPHRELGAVTGLLTTPGPGRYATSGREDDFSSTNSTTAADDLPFEFRALELALETACFGLEMQAQELGQEAYPLLEQLAFKVSTTNLEHVRRLKSSLLALTRRVQKVRDEIEQLMDDDGDMAEMYLTEKKFRLEASHASGAAERGDIGGAMFKSGHSIGVTTDISTPFGSASAPVSPSDSPRRMMRSEHSFSAMSQATDVDDVEVLEMLLEAYFVVIDATLSKLSQLSQYIDDTEDFINIQLDNVRNQLIQFELLLTVATFVVAIVGVVAGMLGMNIPLGIEDDPNALKWVLILCTGGGIVIFLLFLLYFRYKNWTMT